MTPEQIEAAQRALRNKNTEDLTKRIMLHLYRQHQKEAKELLLPFRMIHRHEYPEGEVQPNPYYPNPCSVMVNKDTGDWEAVPEGERLTTDTDIKYWLTRFLTMIDIDQYADTDLTGEAISKEAADAIRDEYRRRIQDYYRNSEDYNTRAWYTGDINGRQYPTLRL